MWQEIKDNYSSKTVMIWSVWWALASCGSFQVQNYIQNLWEVISPHEESGTIYNGAVEAVGTLVCMYVYLIFEPSHEIMVLFNLRKLILQTRMRSYPVGLGV